MKHVKKLSALLLALCLLFALSSAAFAAESGAVNRADVVQRLYALDGSPAVIQMVVFDDAAGSAPTWAHGAGIVHGDGDGLFHGERAVTRAELVTMLHRYAQYKGMDVSVGEDTNILSYDDAFELPAWSVPAFQWACGAGLIGEADRALLPYAAVTDTEFASMLACLDSANSFGWQHFHDLNTAAALSYWTVDSPARNALTDFMAAITDPASPDYIPVSDRIAVFDFDGTLFCETDPNYFDYMLLEYRVLEDPDYKDRASDFEREVANKIKDQNENGTSYSELPTEHGQAVASAFAGMTLAEFNAYIQEFKKQPMPGYTGMTRGSGFYLPMVQVVEYLQANDFTVYVISGTDRLIVRGIFDGNVLDIPNSRIIGSDETIVASKQGGTDGLDYFFAADDELILGGEFIIKNLKMNKVSVIAREIGRQPVLSFGNSSGDNSMAEYVISSNPHRSLAFMLCCDDLARENGNLKKADAMRESCETYGWQPISMRDDWTTIYGDGVTYLGAQKEAA